MSKEIGLAKVTFRGIKGGVVDKRVDKKDVDGYKYVYHFRHADDDWSMPYSMESSVLVNHWGMFFSNKPVKLSDEAYTSTLLTEEEREMFMWAVDGLHDQE